VSQAEALSSAGGTQGIAFSLSDVARRFRLGEASGEELSFVFGEAMLYCVKPEQPGFMAVGEPGAGFVPMYSSEIALARAEGECEWFAAKGVDLVPQVPEGYGIVLDHGSDAEVTLAAWAIKRPWKESTTTAEEAPDAAD